MVFSAQFGFAYRELELNGKKSGEIIVFSDQSTLESRVNITKETSFTVIDPSNVSVAELNIFAGAYEMQRTGLGYKTGNLKFGRALYASIASQVSEHADGERLDLQFNDLKTILNDANASQMPWNRRGCLSGVIGGGLAAAGFYFGLGTAVTELIASKAAQLAVGALVAYGALGAAAVIGTVAGLAFAYLPGKIGNILYNRTLNNGLDNYLEAHKQFALQTAN